jgi:hypothetical protein
MRFEAEQFELKLEQENFRLKRENTILREHFCKVSEAIHAGQIELAKAVGKATQAIFDLGKDSTCQSQNGSA